MVVAVVAVAVLGLTLVYVLRWHAREAEAWAKERNLLISRIQAPEYAPAMAAQATPDPPEDKTFSEERELYELIHGTEEGSDGVA